MYTNSRLGFFHIQRKIQGVHSPFIIVGRFNIAIQFPALKRGDPISISPRLYGPKGENFCNLYNAVKLINLLSKRMELSSSRYCRTIWLAVKFPHPAASWYNRLDKGLKNTRDTYRTVAILRTCKIFIPVLHRMCPCTRWNSRKVRVYHWNYPETRYLSRQKPP